MLTRPALAPHARLLYRGPGTVQLGVCPDTGIVLSGLTEAEITLLTLLDGSRDLVSLRRWGRRMRADPVRIGALLDQLAARGLLRDGTPLPSLATSESGGDPGGMPAEGDDGVDAEAQAVRLRHRIPAHGPELVRQRAARSVIVDGHGNLADAVAATMRQGGYGRVRAGAWAAAEGDLRRRGDHAGDRAGDHTDGHAGGRAHRPGDPDLVILVVADALDDAQVEPWRGGGTPLLPLVTNGATVEVGPVLGGDGPCARCLDLHRADRDPAWPELLAQLTAPRTDGPPPAVVSGAVAALAAGSAATLAADILDLGLVDPGLAFETRPQAPFLLRRRWGTHPRCSCPAAAVTMSA